jgi:hypothetical protein
MFSDDIVLATLATEVWEPCCSVSATRGAANHSLQESQVCTALAKCSTLKLRLLKWYNRKWIDPFAKSFASVHNVDQLLTNISSTKLEVSATKVCVPESIPGVKSSPTKSSGPSVPEVA